MSSHDRPRGRGRGDRRRREDISQSHRSSHEAPSFSQQQRLPPGSSSQPSSNPWERKPGQSARPPYVKPPQSTKSDKVPGYTSEGSIEKVLVESASASGSGDTGTYGRGAMRGSRHIVREINTRPENLVTKKGTTGQPINLQANYFKLLTTTDWCLYQYRVDFAPEEDRTLVRKGLLRLHKEEIGAYIFDGTVLYTCKRLKDNFELYSSRKSDDEKIRITIRFVGEMVRGDHHYLQFFNIIVRKCLELLKLQLVGRNYYDARAKIEIRDFRLELWPGYMTSIRQHENDILMCSEIAYKIMRQESLLHILNDCYEESSTGYKKLFEQRVLGTTVLTGYNNNTYRITDIDFETTPKSTFQLRTGERISYQEYYKKKYQITIRNFSQPLLVSKVKPSERRASQTELIYLVPELCHATGMTDAMRADFRLMRALADHARVAPKPRIDKLMAFKRRLVGEPAIVQELKDWNMTLDDNLVNIPARILPQEAIVLGNNRKVSSGQFADWTRDLQNKVMFNAIQLQDWVVICMNRMRHDVEKFVGVLQEVARAMGCQFATPRYFDLNDDRSNTYTNALEKIMSTSNPKLLYCVVSNTREDRYSAIKKKCVVDRPVPSQVFLAKNLNKNTKSIATKVAIQLVCKLGGAPWSVELPPIDLMVVGYDVCHDPADKSRDYGAMVATLDKNLTRYFSAVNAHTSGEELSNEFSVNLSKALHAYQELNKSLPTHILIYRDGVGEGQIPYVYEHEVEQIKSKLHAIYGKQPLKMAFIIVTKRINTRFFYNQNNPVPGTIVDDIVTNPVKYDFYVISQSVRQGTVSPCAFNIIADTTGWRADQIQRITYKLTHMYYNWSGTVKVPAPCQYAHKLAFLVSQYIRRPPSNLMNNLLYFL